MSGQPDFVAMLQNPEFLAKLGDAMRSVAVAEQQNNGATTTFNVNPIEVKSKGKPNSKKGASKGKKRTRKAKPAKAEEPVTTISGKADDIPAEAVTPGQKPSSCGRPVKPDHLRRIGKSLTTERGTFRLAAKIAKKKGFMRLTHWIEQVVKEAIKEAIEQGIVSEDDKYASDDRL